MPSDAIYIRDLIGSPFAYGGRGPAYDCFGLVLECCRRAGARVPDYGSTPDAAANAARIVEAIAQDWDPCPCGSGAVVTFRMDRRMSTHVGFVLDGISFLHTTEQTHGAVVERLDSPLWERRITGFYRLRT